MSEPTKIKEEGKVKLCQPPLLSEEAFDEWCNKRRKYINGICNVSEICNVCHRKAQREADIKWIKENCYLKKLKETEDEKTD